MAACLVVFLLVLVGPGASASCIGLGSRLVARDQNEAWVSDNGTFAFGFASAATARDKFQVAIWFVDLPGDRTLVWSANRNPQSHPLGFSSNLVRNSLVTKNAFLELDTTGNLVLIDGDRTVWMSNTSDAGVTSASMEETGNFILHSNSNHSAWQSFEHPSDTILIHY
ncbi:PREDICTED: G-type lectin S-receptor-like serine/threonine-protein kinase At5g24080 [Populus euphratica]|uniref:G-type lectin S-receptor-like serine/threonine-protein kinase At5g24080 n=1 Tax=Populus euphratica TaxID=75702 RepID=A0AAJ6TKD4_POPEU|nr:PREDICTED: G-type lectin S-receptor-like serine/threonine-protein kinase At5g24080 [Populus euphratica]